MSTIDVKSVLVTPELEQYNDVFIKNFGASSSKLSVNRLRLLQLAHLPQMSICNYAHQKVLMKNIVFALTNMALDQPKTDLEVQRSNLESMHVNEDFLSESNKSLDDHMENKKKKKKRSSFDRKQRPSLERRPSLDAKSQLMKIDKMQSQLNRDSTHGKVEKIRRRSFDPNDANKEKSKLLQEVEKNVSNMHVPDGVKPKRKPMNNSSDKGMRFDSRNDDATEKKLDAKARAKAYGDAAQKSALADNGLAKIGRKVMKSFMVSLQAERCSLIFLDDHRDEMFFYQNDECIRFQKGTGLAGYAATTGKILNIPDVYADKRFNKAIDKQTGFKTRNMLCAPIHSRLGESSVIAVIQMLNKKGSEPFDSHDEEILDNCQIQVAEALDLQFSTLKTAHANLDSL